MTVNDRLRATSEAVTATMREPRALHLPQDPAPAPRRSGRPLHLRPAPVPMRARRVHPPRHLRGWLAPLTAAATVTALAIALVSIRSGLTEGGSPRPVAQPPMIGAAIPRYYVDLNPVPSGIGLKVIVGDSKTGAVLATFSPPAGYTFGGVTAAADDRTFVVGFERYGGAYTHSWYLLRVRPGTAQPATLARLPIDAPLQHAGVNGLALSPDGRTLAILSVANFAGVSQVTLPGPYTLRTYSMATGGALRTWTSPAPSLPGASDAPDNTKELTWTADGRTLSFRDPRSGGQRIVPPDLRTLDVRSPGHDLIADSHVIAMRGDPYRCNTLQLAADGRTVICGVGPNFGPGECAKHGPEFDAYSTLTGKLTRVLYRYQGPCMFGRAWVLWTGTGLTAIGIVQAQLNETNPVKTRFLPVLLTGHGVTPLHIKLAGVPVPPGWIAF